jgi:hypothetical protein
MFNNDTRVHNIKSCDVVDACVIVDFCGRMPLLIFARVIVDFCDVVGFR